jgi:glycosyltransferase involved in cell wall biosynthesis
MRIGVVNWSSRRVGGVEQYISVLIPALRQSGHTVAFWHELDAPESRPRIEAPAGGLDICMADAGLNASLKLLADWQPDVLYVHGLTGVDVERRLIDMAPSAFFLHSYTGTCISGGKAFTKPDIVPCERVFGWRCLANYFPHGCGGRSPATMWRQYQLQSDRLALLRRYSVILTHSEHMKAEIARHGLDARVVPFPVEHGAQIEFTRARARWHLLYAGRMDELKGGAVLLEALAEVTAASKKPVHVTLAGDGPRRQEWEARARTIEAAVPALTIDFPGWVTQDLMNSLMHDADLLVVPSLWPEPFGSIGPQAAQHGVPAAAFDVGGISQWLEDGVTGHLAPADPPTPAGLADAISKCLAGTDHHNALRTGARKMADRFTMERHLPPLLESLERIAARPAVETVTV